MAVDKEPVHLIFLICYPPSHQTTYLNFIATVAKLLREKDSLQEILEARSAADIFEVMEELSATLVKPEERFAQEKTEQSEAEEGEGTNSGLVLMARLELCTEMLESARAGKEQIRRRIENISALLDPADCSTRPPSNTTTGSRRYEARHWSAWREASVRVASGSCPRSWPSGSIEPGGHSTAVATATASSTPSE